LQGRSRRDGHREFDLLKEFPTGKCEEKRGKKVDGKPKLRRG